MMIKSSFTIGITGNIATGKSVLRRMLTNAGVFGIDADTLANRLLYPGGGAYQQVIDTFGPEIKSDHIHISNKKLGQIVFNDPKALKQLENITHPLVIETILRYIQTAQQPIVSIEAIKLIEAGLGNHCNQLWVSYASFESQMQRLQDSRGLSKEEASIRITAQPPQIEKLSQADVIINTETNFKDTWLRTCSALNDTIQSRTDVLPLHINISKDWLASTINALPLKQVELAWEELAGKTHSELYECLGLKTVLAILKKKHIRAFIIWDNWNFTGTLLKIYPLAFYKSSPTLVFNVFEEHAQINRMEFLLIADEMATAGGIHFGQFGYDQQRITDIAYPAWQIAAQKAISNDQTKVWRKVLAQPFELTNETKFD